MPFDYLALFVDEYNLRDTNRTQGTGYAVFQTYRIGEMVFGCELPYITDLTHGKHTKEEDALILIC